MNRILKNKNKIIKLALKLAVSLFFVSWLVLSIQWQEVGMIFFRINIGWLFFYLLIFIAGIAISAYKWKVLAEFQEIRQNFSDFFKFYLAGMFINNFMPSFVGGDTFKSYQIAKKTKRYKESISVVIVDRLSGLVGAMILALFFGAMNWREFSSNNILLSAYLFSLVSFGFILFFLGMRKINFWKNKFNFLPKKITEFLSILNGYVQKRILIKALFFSLMFSIVGLGLANYVLFRSLGIQIELLDYLSVIFIISIVSSMPISINNIGIKEWAYVTFFGVFGINASIVIAVAIISRFLQMAISFGALPIYIKRNKHKKIKKNNKRKYLVIKKGIIYPFIIIVIGAGTFYLQLFNKKQDKITNVAIGTMKIGVINDLHATGDEKRNGHFRLSGAYQSRMEFFAGYIEKYAPALIVNIGDVIEGTQKPAETGIKELLLVKEFFDNRLSMPKGWVIGNHDLRSINRQQWKDTLGINYTDGIFENENYKIIYLDSCYGTGGPGNDSDGLSTDRLISDNQIAWLERELAITEKIKLVFMHFPPITGEKVRIGYLPADAKIVRDIFSKYEVSAVFSGHVESTVHENIDGVDYYVLPGILKNKIYDNVFTRIRMIGRKSIVDLVLKNESGDIFFERLN